MHSTTDARLRIRAQTALEIGGVDLDLAALAAILEAVAASGSLQAAAERTGRSYRGAWGKISDAEEKLGRKLVRKTKGHGSELTAAGSGVASLVGRIDARVQSLVAREFADIDRELRDCLQLGEARIRLACSHDLLLQQCIAEGRLDFLDLRFMGSPKALGALLDGRADLAGFHVPDGMSMEHLLKRSLRAEPELYLKPLLRREQGLVVARGNPLGIRSLRDLTRPSVRFINRQRGSGTRVWLDHLLRVQGISPAEIRGYPVEEFTHFAVVAAVAAGAADATFALKATASALGLDFVSMGFETYYLCGAQDTLRSARFDDLVTRVREGLPQQAGYRLPADDRLVRGVA